MKKYKMFNKGVSEKNFLQGKWSGNSSDSSSDAQTDPTKNLEPPNFTSETSAENSTPQTAASNGLHYDHYHIAQGELSNRTETKDPSGNTPWHPNHTEKSNGSPQSLSSEIPDPLKQKSVQGSTAANGSVRNDTSAESSTVMTVALGEIGSISKYVSQGIVGMSEMLSTASPEESPDVPVPAAHSEGEDDPNLETQPELTIISAFSLSAEMWENGQEKKPEEKDEEGKDEEGTAVSGEKNQEQQSSGDGDSNGDPNLATESESRDNSEKEAEENSLSCTHCSTVSADASSHKEHLATHAGKKAKVYLHQCSVSDCSYSTNVIREFISHYSVKHADLTSYACRWCKTVTNSLSAFVEHVRENFVVPWVKCPHCYLKKKNKSEVVEHIATEHPGKSQRVIAGSMFLCRNSNHSREKESKVVSESHKTLVSLLSNQKYILNHSSHNGKDSLVGIVDPNPSGNGYQCTDCLFNTTNAQVFLAHMKVCDSMKNVTKQRNVNFECKECSYATSSREDFLNHSHVKASLMNGMKRAPYKKRPAAASAAVAGEVRNQKLIRRKVLSIKKQSVALKLKKDKKANAAAAAVNLETTIPSSGEGDKPEVVVGHFKFNCPYCKEKFHKLNRMKFHIFLNHHDSYSQPIPLHQCLSCHMKSSSEEIVRQHIERTHFGRKSGILLINEPPEVIPRKSKTPDTNKTLVKAIAPITKNGTKVSPRKQAERCSSWGRSQIGNDPKPNLTEIVVQEARSLINNADKQADDEESEAVDSKVKIPVSVEETRAESDVKAGEETNGEPTPPPKNLAMEIVKFTPGDHFTEYIECPQCSYQSRSVMGFYGHIKRHEDLVVHISTRRKYEFHKTKVGSKVADDGSEATAESSTVKMDGNEFREGEGMQTDSKKEGPTEETASAADKTEEKESCNGNADEAEIKECLSPMSPVDPEIKDVEMPPAPTNPPKLESIIINKKSENLIDKDEYSKLGGPILDAKLSSLYTSDEHVKKCNLCGFMAYFPCYIHRHLLSAHLNVHFWECGYCFYRHLQRYKAARHCTRNHPNREQYVKWLGIPDWEKKLAACMEKTKPAETSLPDQDNPAVKTGDTTLTDSPASGNKPPCSPNVTDAAKADGSELEKRTIQIESLPGNLFKCGSCTMCSIDHSQVIRHIRYQHNAEGLLPGGKSDIVAAKFEAGAAVPQKPTDPSLQPPPLSSQPPVSASTPTSTSVAFSPPVLKKSPADQTSKKPGLNKAKPKKKIASSFAVPNTPYRCVFCNYVNLSATEVKKHMWQQHSDELNNVGILLKSKEEGEKSSHASSAAKVGKPPLSTHKAAPVRHKLKRTYRPQKRKKAKTYAKCIKEPGIKKSLTKPSEFGPTETAPKRKYVRKNKVNKDVSSAEISVEDLPRKRPIEDTDGVSPVMPKKRQIQSTQHSDYEWESPSLAEPPNSKSERIYKSVEKTDEMSYRISAFEKSFAEKVSESDVPPPPKYNSAGLTEADLKYNLTMPVFRKAEMDIYKRFIFKTYDGIFLCNYCLVSMSDEIQARHHILEVHPKKPNNPLEQPCKTFQLFRKKTRRPEIIVPIASQPRFNQKPPKNGGIQKKGAPKNKTKSPKKLEKLVPGLKNEPESRASVFEMFTDDLKPEQDGGPEESTAGRFDEADTAELPTLLKVKGDTNYVFTWKWSDQDDTVKPAPQRCTDSEQVSVLRLIAYKQGENVAGHFKCPFCQLTSTSHISVSDHIRLDHMELERHRCRKCPFKSWFSSILENHRKLQHVVSPLFATNFDPQLPTKDETPDDKPDCTVNEHAAQATVSPQELCTNVDGKKDEQPYSEIRIVTDYRTLYLRKFCRKTQTVIFVCKLCSSTTPDQNAFLEHLSIHSGTVYCCTSCTFSTKPKYKMEQHILTDHPPLKANLLVLRHESLITVTDNPHPAQVDQLVRDPPLISPPWTKGRTLAANASEQLTYACSDCPFRIGCLKLFSQHLAHHWNEETVFSTESPSERSYGHLDTFGARRVVDFAVRVMLSDIFSFYSDNVFSFYS